MQKLYGHDDYSRDCSNKQIDCSCPDYDLPPGMTWCQTEDNLYGETSLKPESWYPGIPHQDQYSLVTEIGDNYTATFELNKRYVRETSNETPPRRLIALRDKRSTATK
jgi:hypothetical protein